MRNTDPRRRTKAIHLSSGEKRGRAIIGAADSKTFRFWPVSTSRVYISACGLSVEKSSVRAFDEQVHELSQSVQTFRGTPKLPSELMPIKYVEIFWPS